MKFIILISLILSTTLCAEEIKPLEKNVLMAGLLTRTIMSSSNYHKVETSVKVYMIKDVYNKDNVIVIKKGTTLDGNIKSIDFKSGLANIYLETLVGKNKIKMEIRSADNSPELKGEIRSFKGHVEFGSYVQSFTDTSFKAVGLTDKKEIPELPMGLRVWYGFEQGIAEFYAGDKNKLQQVFYVPSGVQVIVKTI